MSTLLQNLNEWNQPQIFSLFVLIFIILVISLATYIKIKIDVKPDKAPSGFILAMETYVNFWDHTFDETTEGKIPRARIYLFCLATFLLLGNMLGLLGLEPIATSYSITFTLALISWLGIYVVGIMYQKIKFFKKYLTSPIEIIGQFAPLISLSFRIFGNIIGGGAILYLVYYFCGYIWDLIFKTSETWFFFAPIVAPFLHMYFDIFGAAIQSLVFVVLTTVYWSLQAEGEVKKNKQNQIKSKFLNSSQMIY